MNNTKEEKMLELHSLLIESFLQMLRDKEKPVKPSMMACIVAFLRDNGVSVADSKPGSLEEALSSMKGLALPFAN